MTCPKPDLGGVYLPVFADRLCDKYPDCPGGTDEDGSMFDCGEYGTVVPVNSIPSSYILPDKVVTKSSRAACCDVFSMQSAGSLVTCWVVAEFSDAQRPSNGEFHPSLGYECSGERLSDNSSAPPSSVGFSGSWWHLPGGLREHEELIRLELGYGDKWLELHNSAYHFQYDNAKPCPDLNTQKWSPKMDEITCVTFSAATTAFPTTTWNPVSSSAATTKSITDTLSDTITGITAFYF